MRERAEAKVSWTGRQRAKQIWHIHKRVVVHLYRVRKMFHHTGSEPPPCKDLWNGEDANLLDTVEPYDIFAVHPASRTLRQAMCAQYKHARPKRY